jgi:uncharacterized phage protein (TIGR02220 family)
VALPRLQGTGGDRQQPERAPRHVPAVRGEEVAMARYRKAETGLWIDERFQSLSAPPPNGQTLWLYLLTGQRTTTFPGLVVAREAVMADDLGWSLEGFREAYAEVSAKGMAEADWKAGVVLLKKGLLDSSGDPRETAKPESPNVLRSWAKSWDEIPECDLKMSYLRQLGTFAKALGDPYVEAFRESFRKALAKAFHHPSPNQEQEQEQEEEVSGEPDVPALSLVPLVPKPDPIAATAALAIAELNRLIGSRFQADSLAVTKNIKAILGRKHSVDTILAVIRMKVAEWRGDAKMSAYLTPTTILRPGNFEDYVVNLQAKTKRAQPVLTADDPPQRWFPDRSDEVA